VTAVVLERLRVPAPDFHHRDLPAVAGIWVVEVERPAMVLGSTQDLAAALDDVAVGIARAASPLDLARRRSGGGAVWLAPGEHAWVDVVVPAGHRRWERDVGRAMWWIGEVWRGAVEDVCGPELPVQVHRGPMLTTAWSRTVCFAGVGPGEVLDGHGRKVVGISQRRTREAARFQCALLARWDPVPYSTLLAAHPPTQDLEKVGVGVGAARLSRVLDGFVAGALAALG
jgi:lipoate---protein ligase